MLAILNLLIQEVCRGQSLCWDFDRHSFLFQISPCGLCPLGNPRANVYILYTLMNSSSLMCLICHSISEYFLFTVWIFFIRFISVLIKLNLNMPSILFLYPWCPRLRGNWRAVRAPNPTATFTLLPLLLTGWRVWMPAYQRRPCWPFSLWAICNLTSTCRVSSHSSFFDSFGSKSRDDKPRAGGPLWRKPWVNVGGVDEVLSECVLLTKTSASDWRELTKPYPCQPSSGN